MPVELKTKKEIAKLELVGKLTAEIRTILAESAKPGMTTQDLDNLAVKEMKKRKVETVFLGYEVHGRTFPKNICTSVNEEIVHGIPHRNKVLKDGDIISIDIATKRDGFVGDTAVTVPVGTIPDELVEFLRISQESLWKGIEASVLGNRLGDVGNAVDAFLRSHGLHVVPNFYGHGIGRKMHEEPQVKHYGEPGTGYEMRKGLAFTIEPMICQKSSKAVTLDDGWTVVSEDGLPAAHFEHSLVVTKEGPIVLTQL